MDRVEAKTDLLWKQLWSLAALYASVVIGWIAYYNYQPKLLEQYNFTDLTLFLFISQGIILTITPLIAGKLGDRFRQSAGHRLPIISAGISFAAMIFMAVAFTLIVDPGETFRWILPILIVFFGWLPWPYLPVPPFQRLSFLHHRENCPEPWPSWQLCMA